MQPLELLTQHVPLADAPLQPVHAIERVQVALNEDARLQPQLFDLMPGALVITRNTHRAVLGVQLRPIRERPPCADAAAKSVVGFFEHDVMLRERRVEEFVGSDQARNAPADHAYSFRTRRPASTVKLRTRVAEEVPGWRRFAFFSHRGLLL